LFEVEKMAFYSTQNAAVSKQVTLLSQRGRAMLRVIEYFAKSLKVVRNVCKSLLVLHWNYVSRTVSEIFSIK